MAAVPIIALMALFKNWGKIYRIPKVQIFFSRIPTVGNLINKTAAMVSFRILALLLQANVRVATALEIAAKSANHVEFEEFFLARARSYRRRLVHAGKLSSWKATAWG